MKPISKLLAKLMLGSLVFSACHKKDLPPVVSFLKADKTSLAETAVAGKDSFVVSANVTWKLSGLPAGFTSNISNGSEVDTKVVITYPANTTISTITGDIIITPTSGTGVRPVTVKLSQSAAAPSLKTDSTALNLKGAVSSIDSFIILSNIDWKVSVSAPETTWLGVNTTSGTINKKIFITALQANTTNGTRTGTITISPVNNSSISPVTITVSQKPVVDLVWSKTFGGSSGDVFYSIKKTPDGGYIAVGYTNSTAGDATGNHGGYDILLVKLDENGIKQWSKSYGGSGDEFGRSIIVTGDGYVILGVTNSSDGDIPVNLGGQDIVVIKTDFNGRILWENTFGGNSDEQSSSIVETANGFVIAGHTASRNGDGAGNHGGNDALIVKIDSLGKKIWAATYGGSGDDYANAIVAAPGGFVITGFTSSTDGDFISSHGGIDVLVMKIGFDGSKQWAYTYGGSDSDYTNSIIATTDGYIITGYTYSGDGDITFNHGSRDCLVMKIDTNGRLVWNTTYGGADSDVAISVIEKTDGYVVAGVTGSTDGDILSNHGGKDLLLTKIDAGGKIKWLKTIGGTNDDWGLSILSATDGYVIAGYTGSNNGDISSNNGSDDAWIIRIKE